MYFVMFTMLWSFAKISINIAKFILRLAHIIQNSKIVLTSYENPATGLFVILNDVFVCAWNDRCPDTAPVGMKMLYASSKDALKKKLVGINHEIQATEYSELSKHEVTEKVKSRKYK